MRIQMNLNQKIETVLKAVLLKHVGTAVNDLNKEQLQQEVENVLMNYALKDFDLFYNANEVTVKVPSANINLSFKPLQ